MWRHNETNKSINKTRKDLTNYIIHLHYLSLYHKDFL